MIQRDPEIFYDRSRRLSRVNSHLLFSMKALFLGALRRNEEISEDLLRGKTHEKLCWKVSLKEKTTSILTFAIGYIFE